MWFYVRCTEGSHPTPLPRELANLVAELASKLLAATLSASRVMDLGFPGSYLHLPNIHNKNMKMIITATTTFTIPRRSIPTTATTITNYTNTNNDNDSPYSQNYVYKGYYYGCLGGAGTYPKPYA